MKSCLATFVDELEFYEIMFSNLQKSNSFKDEEDYESFKKWALSDEAPHDPWTVTLSGGRLCNVWRNHQRYYEGEKLKEEHSFKGNKYICKVCGKKKNKPQFYKFEFSWISGKYSTVSYENGYGICKDCHKADVEKRKQSSEEHRKELRKQWYQDHKEEIAAKQKQNRTARNESNQKYRKTHREQINKQVRERKQSDPVFKLKSQARNTIYNSFARTGHVKQKRCENITGLSQEELVSYLCKTYERRYGKAWDGNQQVHIDHIIPLTTAKTEEDVINLCHYTNLQLLTAQDNLKKGSKYGN